MRWVDMRARRTGQAAFLLNKVGLAGCDMGACEILQRTRPVARIRTALYGRFRPRGGRTRGSFSRIVAPDQVLRRRQ